MINAWAVFGHMAMDSSFREELLGDAFQKKLAELAMPMGVWKGYALDMSHRLGIPEDHFKEATVVIRKKVKGPIGLTEVGEVLAAMRFPAFPTGMRNLGGLIEAAAKSYGILLAKANPMFYVAAGAVTLDPALRRKFRGGEPLKTFGFDDLAPLGADEADLKKLYDIPAIDKAALDVCEEKDAPWTDGCQLNMLFWPNYRHPLGSAPRRSF